MSVFRKKDDSLIGAAQRNVLRDKLSISVTDRVGFERWSGNTQGMHKEHFCLFCFVSVFFYECFDESDDGRKEDGGKRGR